MEHRIGTNTQAILNYIKEHPGVTSVQIADALTATHTFEDVRRGLWSLWIGRYLKRKEAPERGKRGQRMFSYTLRAEHPRYGKGVRKPKHKRPRRVKAAPESRIQESMKPSFPDVLMHQEEKRPKSEGGTEVGTEVEVLVAVKGSKETAVLTLPQVMSLVRQFKDLV